MARANTLAILLKYVGCSWTDWHAQCHLSLFSFRRANGGWCSLTLSPAPRFLLPRRHVKSSWPSDGARTKGSSRTSRTRGKPSMMQQRLSHWPTTRALTVCSVNYTLDIVRFARGALSLVHGTRSAGKKKGNRRNKVTVCYTSPFVPTIY